MARPALHRDPRFSRDYRAVFADPSATAPLGLFVRRDLVPNGVSMDELRARFSR